MRQAPPESDGYYSYYDSEEEDAAPMNQRGPPPAARQPPNQMGGMGMGGPPRGGPPMNPGMTPRPPGLMNGMGGGARSPPPLPNMGGFASPRPAQPEEEYEDEYEYEYDEEYEYEYEYDEEDAGGHGMARPKGSEGMGMSPMGGGMQNPMGGGMPNPMGGMQFNPADLMASRNGLKNAPDPEDQPRRAAPVDRPFGLTSTKIGQLRTGLNQVEKTYERQPVQQRDFRGNLQASGKSNGGGARDFNKAQPAWQRPNLRPGARPMTTNLQNVDTDRIRAQVQAASSKQKQKYKRPEFINGVPTSTRFRAAGIPKKPPPGRMSAKIALERKQDPSNPNKFLTKNRVSYRVKKNPGAGRTSTKKFKKPEVASRTQTFKPEVGSRATGASMPPGMPGPRPPAGMGGGQRASRRTRDPNKPRDPNRVSVKKYRRRPNVQRTSVNHNIFGAKTTTNDTPGVGKGDGCYLRFDNNKGGCLFAQWTAVGFESKDALAYFKPNTPVPRFNYRRNEGRVDLMTGTSNDFINYAEAWTYFWALAKEHDGMVSILDMSKQNEFRVDFVGLSPGLDVQKLSENKEIATTGWVCIACLPAGSNAFNGVQKVNADFFMNNAGREGHAVRLVE